MRAAYALPICVALPALTGCAVADALLPETKHSFTHVDAAPLDSAVYSSLALPMDLPPVLAANFAELRPNHFHNGLDFKTNMKTGVKVYSVADGYVSRILVSPYGYGLGLYVTHPALGLTSIYGHLESFSDEISAIVARQQKSDKCFEVDIRLPADSITVKKGDLLALSGNSGSSFGPHLHFALADTAVSVYYDPMHFYIDKIKDTKAPQPRSMAILPLGGQVTTPRQEVATPGDTLSFEAWGTVYPAIEAYDSMDGTNNIYGIHCVALSIDGKETFRYTADRVESANSRAINTLVHYPTLIDDDIMMMVTTQPKSLPLSPMISGDGVIDIKEERDYKGLFTLTDNHGNKAEVPFVIRGVKADIPADSDASGNVVEWQKGKRLVSDGFAVTFPPLSFYQDTRVMVTRDPAVTGTVSPIFTIGDKHIPLACTATLEIAVTTDTIKDKQRYVIAAIDEKGRPTGARASAYADGRVKADISSLGTYAVVIDSNAPTVKPLSPSGWRSAKEIRINCGDNLSGIVSWQAYIDDKWVVAGYDGKNRLMSIPLSDDILSKGKHQLKFTATDAAGNSTTITQAF